jgi:cytoskeletal protein RodZ
MLRIVCFFVTAVAAAAGLTTSGAQACISCDYVPPVVNSGVSKPSSGARSYESRPSKKRSHSAARERRTKITRDRNSERKSKSVSKTQTQKPAAAPVAASSDVAAITEHSSISVAAPAVTEQATAAEPAPAVPTSESEHSTISTTSVDHIRRADAKQVQGEATPNSNVGCKKFFPSVGLTLSVPCE